MITAGLWRYGDWRHVATGCNALVMAALWHRAGHYIFALRFLLSSSSSIFLFSSPNLSRCRLDVLYSTHMLWPYCEFKLQIWNVMHAARWKYSTQKSPKIRHLGTVAQLCRAISSQLRHVSTIGKNVRQQYLPHMSSQYGELRPTSSWDRFGCLGHPSKFQRVSRLGFVTARHSSCGRQPNFVALNRGRHLCSAGRPSRWALTHILVS